MIFTFRYRAENRAVDIILAFFILISFNNYKNVRNILRGEYVFKIFFENQKLNRIHQVVRTKSMRFVVFDAGQW